MTDGQRAQLFDKLIGGIPKDCLGAYNLMAALTEEELDKIEPLIDRWNTEAFEAGKRFFRLQTEEQILKLGERA